MKLLIRTLLSAAMLAVLVWRLPDVKWGDLSPNWTTASVWWLAAATLTMSAAFALSALRWQRVLSAMGPTPSYRRMLSIFLAGQFVSNVLPTAFGGDVIRVTRLGREIEDHPRAFASVTIERMTGWLVLPVISVTALIVQPRLRSIGAVADLAWAIAAGTVTALVVVLLVASNRRFAANPDEVTGWRRFLVAIHLGIDALRRDPTATVEVISAGGAFQVLQCGAVWMAAQAIGVTEVTLGVSLAFFPAVAIAQNLPVGIGGLGIRESLFVLFFGAVNAPEALSITLGLVVYGLTIATSALGAPAFVLGARHRPGQASPSQNPHTEDVTPKPPES